MESEFMFSKKRKSYSENDIARLEDHLGAVLQEIDPGVDFRQRLSDQLRKREIPPYIEQNRERLKKTLLITGGVIGSLLIVVTSVRTVISILGLFKLVTNRKQTPNISQITI